MYTSEIIIVALVAVLEIDSSNVPIDRQILLRPLSSQYSAVDAISPKKNFIVQNYQNAPKKYVHKINPTSDYRYHGKKDYLCWLDPIEYNKQSRSRDKSCYSKNLKKTYLVAKGNDPIKDRTSSENLNLPSIYLQPPKITNNNNQYYKIRETQENQSKPLTRNRAAVRPKSHKPKNERTADKNYDNDRPVYIRDHAPEQVEATDDEETNENEYRSGEKSKESQRAPKDRIEFHLHGHAGPETYVFGFDTGNGENRQYRMEERHEDGTITGFYGYIDARGKLRKVRYKASPTLGYEEKHHETNGQE